MWYEESIIYQIYPLGFCGAPFENDGQLEHRLRRVTDWIPHLQRLGVTAVFFNPLWESISHGYDTADYRKLDVRLGTNDDLKALCAQLHEAGFRVILDGVFNHVGRGFWAFQDVLQKREQSAYRDWFHIDFNGNNYFQDGLWYEGWEGHESLVKLNLRQPAVLDHILDNVTFWMDEFHIDGIRLDVAYLLDKSFLERLRQETTAKDPSFFLVGEMIHGNYRDIVNPRMLHSATNYECYKGLYSSFNSHNMFEIGHSLKQQFGPEDWTKYKGLHLLNFADNHDVSRIASELADERQLPALYGLLFAMPGIPCLYYGSEWAVKGAKCQGDQALRPYFERPEWTELSADIAQLCRMHQAHPCLSRGNFSILLLTNGQMIFQRQGAGERILVAINANAESFTAHFDAGGGQATELLSGRLHDFGGGSELPPFSLQYWLMH